MKKLLLTILTTLMFSAISNAQQVAVNTDLAMDALMAPSLGVEMVLGKRSSVSLNGLFFDGVYGHDVKAIALQPEWRVYLSGRPMFHHFVGVGVIGATYTFNVRGKVYDGDAAGIGLTFGYTIPISKYNNKWRRFSIDLHGGLGFIFYRQKEYFKGDKYDKYYTENGHVKANATGMYTLPTRIGVSLTYLIK